MKRIVSVVAVCAMVVAVGTGCNKAAKINLAGLSEQGPGSVDGGNGAAVVAPADIDDDGSLSIKDMDGAGAGKLDGIDPNAVAGWTDTKQGLSGGMLNGQPFVKNGNYWAEKVYFDFNRYEVRPAERVKLDKLAEHLRANPTFRVVIEGHTDDRGSDEYNRSLAERRSMSIQTYLIDLGIDDERMQTVSYGEDRPAVVNAHTEAEHQQNRRGEFLVGLP